MKRSLTLPLLFTAVLSIAGCGGASFLSNSQTSTKTSTQSSAISAVSVTCSPSTVSAGGAAQCQAIVSGSGAYSSEVTWSVDAGTISNSGLYTAPAVVSGTASATVTATSKQDKNKSGRGVLNIGSSNNTVSIDAVSVVATPSSISMGQTATCSATVTGTGSYSRTVTWSATGGTITSGGVFTPSGVGTGACIATSTQSGYTNVSGQAAIIVTSTGTSSSLSASTTTIAFGTVNLNTPATQAVTLTASGTTAVTVSAASVSGTGFSLSGATLPITLNPNQTVQLFVAFDPTVAGPATGQLKITSNASSGATTLVNLTGSGQGVTYQVNLSWNAPATSADPVAGYNVFRAPTGSSAFQQVNTSAVTTTSYVDGSVQNGTAYDYVVRSVDAAGAMSDASNTYTATIPN